MALHTINPSDYAALTALWPSLPSGDTTAQKIVLVNAMTVATPQPAILSPSQILNACTAADLEGLTVTQISLMQMLFAGSSAVDASNGTAIRAVFTNIFTGKPSLTGLANLVAPFDNHTDLWINLPVAQGGGGLNGNPVTLDICNQLGLV